jgi:cytochrome P450
MYFPFSLGKRNCVGQNMASLELKVVLARLFRNFRFEAESQVMKTDWFLTLKPAEAHLKAYAY